jgi:hypothetical protein
MSVLKDTWRFLVQRKLWPAALLLVAAAVAVPKLLTEEPPAAVADPVVVVKADKRAVLATDPIVVAAGDADRSGRRSVLGSAKDPFKPEVVPTPTPDPAAVKPADPKPDTPDAPSPGGSPVSGGSPAVDPVPTTPAQPKKQYELYELSVRFGLSSDATQPPRKDVKRLQALPSSDEPVLIYLGVLKDNKTAVFMLDSGVIAQGDGTCRPSRTSCETIHIKAGETEFFDIAVENEDGSLGEGVQYQLDVVAIRKTQTSSAKKAAKSVARVSSSGQKIVRARIAGDGPLRYRYDKRSGRLEKLSRKAYKAVVAKAATAARAHF